PFTRATCSSPVKGQTNAWIWKLPYRVGSRASLPSRMLSQSSPSKRAMSPSSDNSGVYKNAGRNQQRGMFPPVRIPSTCQMSRDECRSRPDRGRGLERQASSGQVEMVAAERIHVTVLGGAEVRLERETERRQVRVEGEGDGRRPRDGPAVGFCETRGIVRIIQTDRHAAASHVGRR